MFRKFCFLAVTSAANPFIPGITLSAVLAEAAKHADEGERKTLIEIREGIDELLLEMFERLPQTVSGFDGVWTAVRTRLTRSLCEEMTA